MKTPIEHAVTILRAGGLVAFPTETVFGLGGDPTQDAALARIFQVKGRETTKALSLLVGPSADLSAYAQWDPRAERLAAAFWPGPLTMVLPRGHLARDALTGGAPTVGLRMPNHPVPLALLEAFGAPLAAPSANRSGSPSPTLPEHVAADLGMAVSLILPGTCAVGLESTVLLLDGAPRVLRPGVITADALAEVLGEPVGTQRADASYRTRAPLRVLPSADIPLALSEAVGPVALLSRAPLTGAALWRRPPEHPEGYATALYALLRDLDQPDITEILVEALPEGAPWALLRDRLRFAAHEPLFPSLK